MRWSIIRIIWFRELRDQLRDRRTLIMIAVLPVFLYPVAGYGLMEVIGAFLKKSSVIEVQGAENLPQWSPLPAAASLLSTPLLYPPLLVKEGETDRISEDFFDNRDEAKTLDVILSGESLPKGDLTPADFVKLIDRSRLNNRQCDLILVVPPNFRQDLEDAKQPKLYVLGRPSDDRSRLVNARLSGALNHWGQRITDVRLIRIGKPTNFDEPFSITDPEKAKPSSAKAADELFDVLVKVFPFILVMWSLAGALYPAIDLCAGEKERGTMETLLISPASREEIVWGKFLTIWVFSAATALLNLFSMGFTTMHFTHVIKIDAFRPMALLWGVLLLLPLSAFFSAVSLAVGAYARSSKEGQYYLMPLFFLTMPLIFLTLVPDIKLNPFYSMVPITGVALLLQELMAAGTPSGRLLVYFVPVLGPMLIYSWLALRWAIGQFQREEVLFREAERLDLGLWLRRMFREKEALPSAGQALFCFALVLGLSKLSVSFGDSFPLMVQLGVRYLAFVATPALFMALLVTRRPLEALALKLPSWWALPVGGLLAVLLFVPNLEYSHLIVDQIPAMKVSLEQFFRSQSSGFPTMEGSSDLSLRWQAGLVVLLGAVCEELAFRGFILSGLRTRFKPLMAVFLSSFLFALSQMNVFQFVPHFVVGVALGVLVVRTGSVWPAIFAHLIFNALIYGPIAFPETFDQLRYAREDITSTSPLLIILSVLCLIAAAGLLYAVWRWSPEKQSNVTENVATVPLAKQTPH
jgi:sodium transport system permease protein